MHNIAITCKKIKKSYGENDSLIEALKGVDMEIEEGKLTFLVGPSGSGKSTLLSIITAILTPDEGQLFIMGHEVSNMTAQEKSLFCRNNLGIVFQSLFLIPTLTVAENVSIPLLIAGHTEQKANEITKDYLKKVNIEHRYHAYPSNLSKGQQQRVAIARAMVNDSKIIVCDEPTSALDQAAGLEIMKLLKDLTLYHARTVLVVTHDHRIFSFADRIIYLNDGQITPGKKNE